MHLTALKNGENFFRTYVQEGPSSIIEIGSQNVNGSLRSVAPAGVNYVGFDFVSGHGVDVVLDDPYSLPLAEASVDVVVSSSCFEHSEFFWLLFLEIMRVLRPDGLFYLNAPSNGSFHRYPVDCWRFYPDSGVALARWAQRNGLNPVVLESFTTVQEGDVWNDFVCVFLKDESFAGKYARSRMLDSITQYTNAFRYPDLNTVENFSELTEDQHNRVLKRAFRRILS